MPLADAQYCALSFWNGFKCAPSIAQWPLSQPASPTPQLSPTWWAKASPVRSCRPWWRHPSKNTFYLHRLVISFHSKVYCYNVNMCIHVLYTNVLGLGAASVDFSSTCVTPLLLEYCRCMGPDQKNCNPCHCGRDPATPKKQCSSPRFKLPNHMYQYILYIVCMQQANA